MNLYLVRHSEAENIKKGQNDFDRELTESGKSIISNAANNWIKIIKSIDFLVSSQLIRAKQTAEIIKQSFQFQNEIIFDNRLNPGCKVENIIDILNELNGNNILIVGHQPDLSKITSALISDSIASIDFKKGTIAKISFDGKIRTGNGVLEFLIIPKIFS